MHLEWSLFRPCLDSRFQGRVTALLPQLSTPRLGVLGSQGEAGEAALIIQLVPLGWESQGYNSLMCKGRSLSLLGGKPEPSCLREQAGQAAALGCAAKVEDAKKRSSIHPQDSSLPSSVTVSGIKDVQLPVPQRSAVRGGKSPLPHTVSDQLW